MSRHYYEYVDENGHLFRGGVDCGIQYGSGEMCPEVADLFANLVERAFPEEFRYAMGEDKSGDPLKGKEREKWEELDESDNWNWNVPFYEVGYFDPEYCYTHLKQFITMIEESKTYAELQAKWQAFYKQVPKDKIIHICT